MATYIYRPPVITILNDHEFELVEPFAFEWEHPIESGAGTTMGAGYQLTVPTGYPFDGASVPRICWSLTGLLPTGVHLGAAAAHDFLYQRRGHLIRGELKRFWLNEGVWKPVAQVFTRKQCDDLFLRIMQDAGETPWKAWAMHRAVRLLGGAAWSR